MKKIDRVLHQAIPQKEILRKARANKIMSRWPEIVGEKLSAKSWPDNFENGAAYIAVEGSAWAQELRLLKQKLLDKMNALANEPALFTDLRFGTRKLPQISIEGKKPKTRIEKTPHTPRTFKSKWLEQENEEGT